MDHDANMQMDMPMDSHMMNTEVDNHTNTGMVMMNMGPNVFGISLFNLLLIISGLFYLVCAGFLWIRIRKEKTELMFALFAFLMYQALNMFFMGLEYQTMNSLYGYLSGLSILIGSAYMLKFPFHSFAANTRKTIFIFSLIIAFGIFGWFFSHPGLLSIWTDFTLWYDFAINGVVVGGFIIYFAFKTTERWLKFKAVGGGTGVMACCIVANVTMLSGALFVSSVFQFLAPIMILGTLAYARKKQKIVLASA